MSTSMNKFTKPHTLSGEVTDTTSETPTPVEIPVIESMVTLSPVVEVALAPDDTTAIYITVFNDKVDAFTAKYDTKNVANKTTLLGMVRAAEDILNVIINAPTYSVFNTLMDKFRKVLELNQNDAFNKMRLLGNMREPRTGQILVKTERHIHLLTLLYMTMTPKQYRALKGRIDISHIVNGHTEQAASFIQEYYG